MIKNPKNNNSLQPHLVHPGHDGEDGGVGDESGLDALQSQAAGQLLALVGRR